MHHVRGGARISQDHRPNLMSKDGPVHLMIPKDNVVKAFLPTLNSRDLRRERRACHAYSIAEARQNTGNVDTIDNHSVPDLHRSTWRRKQRVHLEHE